MLIERLSTKAKKEKTKFHKLKTYKESDNILLFFKYLFYRVRFPLLARLTFKLIIILEVATVYYLFGTSFFNLVAIILFLSLCMKGLLKGGMQYFRLKLVEFQKRYDQERCNDYYFLATNYSVLIGLINSLIIVCLALLLQLETSSLLIALSTLLIMPLESLSLSLWTISYTQRRLKKEYLITSFYKTIPILSALLLHPVLDEYSYIIGYVTGNLFYIHYHYRIANEYLKFNFYEYRKPSNLKKFIYKVFKSRQLRSILSLPLSYYLYLTLLGLFLFFHSSYYWKQFIFFYFAVSFLSGFAAQVSRSHAMDIHLSLKSGLIEKAYHYIKQICIFAAIFLALTLGLLILVYNNIPYWLGYSSHVLVNFFALVLFAVLARTFFETSYKAIEASKTEPDYQVFTILYFMVLGATLQFVFIFIWHSNIQGIILLDSALCLVASLIFFGGLNMAKSMLITISNQQLFRKSKSLKTSTWLAINKTIQKLNMQNDFALIILDRRYQTRHYSNYLGKSFYKAGEVLIWQTEILPGILLVSYTSESSINSLQFKFSGFIRFFYKIDLNNCPSQELKNIQDKLKLFKYKEPNLNLAIKALEIMIKQDCFESFKTILNQKNSDVELMKFVKNLYKQNFSKELTVIYKDQKNRITTSGQINTTRAREIYWESEENRSNSLFKFNSTSKYIVFSLLGQTQFVCRINKKLPYKKQLTFLCAMAMSIEFWATLDSLNEQKEELRLSFSDYQFIAHKLLNNNFFKDKVSEEKKPRKLQSPLVICNAPRYHRYIYLKPDPA